MPLDLPAIIPAQALPQVGTSNHGKCLARTQPEANQSPRCLRGNGGNCTMRACALVQVARLCNYARTYVPMAHPARLARLRTKQTRFSEAYHRRDTPHRLGKYVRTYVRTYARTTHGTTTYVRSSHSWLSNAAGETLPRCGRRTFAAMGGRAMTVDDEDDS